ncbi:MAG: bifunctional diaminohydroxyphosphoribosylaminopyrimidine deaminase/5-amino-6-(5-phosphoribosylamino)uracil reductase RibD [Tannerellaceae bacterium]|jgi:diaminohydroxyphosphoribosylaminopyrimidine deaminase/5-amino-6-(5-phosphoribosylamino)uracil reductase|nr:bifunctional diaminohydroxyphosphoribosylaminopyrimidine deaminase/5-amino-6-(5-phosphoribosylamino)uracil reductase RibD [Tannerellaceae bacterium]
MEAEEKYMERCLALARHGRGKVNPNPMVGAVIVHKGKIIGEGFHRQYGGAHAEVNAVASVADEALLRSATLYVNLEPCSHYGLTPPCTELIIHKQIPRVVIGCPDPYPEVSGRGILRLRQAGIEVITGVLEAEARELNKVFIRSHTLKRPYIYLKWAQSADGFIDRLRTDASERPVLFSSPLMLQQVHKRRSEVSAIMVGTRTALLDNPSLTVRHWSGPSPVRVVLDRRLAIPPHYHLLDGQSPTLVFTATEQAGRPNVTYIRTDFGRDVLKQVLSRLYSLKLTSLLVEGGAHLLSRFLQEGLYDEIQVETSPLILGEGVKAPSLAGIGQEFIH